MRIRTRLRMNAWIALSAALLAFFPLFLSYRTMSSAKECESFARNLRRTQREMQVLRDEYLYSHEDRARVQWFLRSERLRSDLKIFGQTVAASPARYPQAEALGCLNILDATFSRIVADRTRLGTDAGAASPGEELRIAKLKGSSYQLSDYLARMEEVSEIASDAARDRTITLLGIFIVMGFSVTVGNSALLNRMLSRRLAALREGAELIGSGNLDHRLDVRGDDELADLGRLTNRMAANLQGTFTSVASLEAEIARRTAVERALIASEVSLRRAEGRATMLNRIANVFLTVADEAVYSEVLAIVLDVMGSRYGIFGYLADTGELVIPTLTENVWDVCQVEGKSIVFPPESWGKSLWGTALREKRAIVSTGPFRIPEGHLPIDNFLAVPIVFADRSIGLISVANSEQGYDEERIALLVSIASSISPVLNAQLQKNRQEQERKQAEEALRFASEYNRTLIEVSLDPLVTIDAAGRITDVNVATEKITGQAREELIGTDFSDHFTEPERARAGYQLAFRDGSVRDYPLEIRSQDGRVAQVLYNASVYRDREGAPVGVFAARDITERQRAEESLLKLSIAVEQSPVSILITDTSGTIEFVNPKFTQISGYDREEVLGRNPRMLKSGETPPDTYRRLWEAISSGKVWQGVFHNRKKDGGIFLEFATIAPVKNPQGVITNYIAIKEDITERRSLENQLRQSQKMEAIGTLAGGVAHDFNNILTAIIGFGSLLEMKMAKSDPLHHNVEQILTAAERAARLTRSLLAFSRKQQIETRVMNLCDIVSGLEKMLHRLIPEDIELMIEPAGEPLSVLVDAGQIEQILINLVTNARDAMPDGGRLGISIGRTTLDEAFRSAHGYGEPGEYALVVVADHGVGMEESVRARIFDPFFTTKEVGKGTGLGLSVCYGIVKQHGGYINCYSEPGRGTTFRIYLPLVPGGEAADERGEAVHPEGGAETILLAEDDVTVRNLTTHILKEFGYTVIEAVDGEDAVEKFKAAAADIKLCLFDVIMPKKRGWEAFAAIRQIRADARVLFMSGYQPDFDRLNELTESGAGFITKPVVPRELLRKVRELLDG